MYTIRCDSARNRLYVTLQGAFSLEEMTRCVDETIATIGQLSPGYEVVTDISQMEPGNEAVAAEVARVQSHFVVSGAKRGVRVVGESLLSGLQFKRTGHSVGYHSINVSTLEEAETYLSTP